MTGQKLVHRAHDLFFGNVHGHRLIYNACWEDPRVDRRLLELDRNSRVVMITSAGCNALDYLLDAPAEINAVDVNPRQNAVLHLKSALIGHGDYDDLFALFGRGSSPDHNEIYDSVRHHLPGRSRAFWDRKIHYFDTFGQRRSFYYHGTSGTIAWLFRQRWRVNPPLWQAILQILEARDMEEQVAIYARIERLLFGLPDRWLMDNPVFMAMAGVPRAQMQMVRREVRGGIREYIRGSMRHVATEVPTHDNYFYRVYITGSYTPTCCPEYLKESNFERLRENIDHVRTHTSTLAAFLTRYPGEYTHYVLLDHQDWLAWHRPHALAEEWKLILQNSRPGTRILLRSAGHDVRFIPESVRSRLRFFPERTEPLHRTDRVGTYASLHMAEVR